MSDSVEIILTSKPEFFGRNTTPDEAAALTVGIRQYQQVAAAFNELWSEINARVETPAWEEDGVGSCHASPHLFDALMGGPLGYRVEDLWGIRSRDYPEDDYHDACQFHREGQGCILGDLKSPRCIDHVDGNHDEIEDLLNGEIHNFRIPLIELLRCGYDYENTSLDTRDCRYHPEVNETLVEETVAATQALINHVRTKPLLRPVAE